MADIWVAKKAQEMGIPMMVLAHDEGWIKHSLKVEISKTLAMTERKRDHLQTETVNAIEWQIHEPA